MSATEAAIANPEVQVELNGKTYRLVVTLASLNALDQIACERHDKKSILQGINWRELSTRDMTTVLWSAFRRHHPEVTLQDVENMVDAGGVVRLGVEIVALVTKLIENSLPVVEKLSGPESATALKKSLMGMGLNQSTGSISSPPES